MAKIVNEERVSLEAKIKANNRALKQNQTRQKATKEKMEADQVECLALENRIGDLKVELAELEEK